jgi:hypothetical protein
MITEKQKTEIIKVLGSNYIQAIKTYMNKEKIFSPSKRSFSDRTISRVLNGDQNSKIENAIVDLWEIELKNLKAAKERKQRLLSASKEFQNI